MLLTLLLSVTTPIKLQTLQSLAQANKFHTHFPQPLGIGFVVSPQAMTWLKSIPLHIKAFFDWLTDSTSLKILPSPAFQIFAYSCPNCGGSTLLRAHEIPLHLHDPKSDSDHQIGERLAVQPGLI